MLECASESSQRRVCLLLHITTSFLAIFGIKNLLDALPKRAHIQYAFSEIAREHFVKEGLYYLDMWPLGGWLLIVVSPSIGVQATQMNLNLAMDRPVALLRKFFMPIAGGDSLFHLKEWKHWRPIFKKGFSSEQVLALVPGMVNKTRVYAETLRNLGLKNELVYLDTTTLRFTIDLVGRNVL